MASGNIENPWETVSFTPTVETANGFDIRSWGWVNGTKIGRIAIVVAQGIYNSSSVSTDKIALSIPYKALAEVNAIGMTTSTSVCYVSARPSGSNTDIYMNSMQGDKPYYFQIIIPLA